MRKKRERERERVASSIVPSLFLFALLVLALPGDETKISGAHLRGNVQFYGSRLTPYVSRLVEPLSRGEARIAKLKISRYRPRLSLPWTTFRRCLGDGIALTAFVARSTPARAMLHQARTYVWIITRACDEFAIIVTVLSLLYGSPMYSGMCPRRVQQTPRAAEFCES